MAVTLKDVALEAGVSISTVSRTINGDLIKKASPETEKRIWAAVSKLGYMPNQTARNLVSGVSENGKKTFSIGIIQASSITSFVNPFFNQLLNNLLDEIQIAEYSLKYTIALSDMSKSSFFSRVMKDKVDGAIIMGRIDVETFNVLKANIPHLVYVGLNSVGLRSDEVICDGSLGAKSAIEYLIDKNFKKIGFLGPIIDDEIININSRYSDYFTTLEKHNIEVDDAFIKHALYNTKSGYDAMLELINNNTVPEAIFCSADEIAIGALRALHENNIKVPKDISVLSMGNSDVSEYLVPSLSTIHIPKNDLARLSVNMLVDRITKGRDSNIRVDVPYELIERETVKK